MGDASTSRARWELENTVQQTSSEDVDALFKYDHAEQQVVQQQKPWTKDPHFFKHVRMSALALLKMAMHARSGGNLEVMGMLQGKIVANTFVVIDTFALPVEGTETRVNAQAEAYEYMVDFADTNKQVHRLENVVGWYHSHPGYGCWLSGIDCSTQMLNQQFQEPFLAIVVDPVRTMASGKVDIAAFRTYPEGYKPPDVGPSEYQTIPLSKIEDFGVHANQYYSLDITFFKSSTDSHMLDLLWNKYWVNTLSASPLISNRDFAAGQISDIAEKLEQAETSLQHGARLGMGRYLPGDKKREEGALLKICRDTSKMSTDQIKGLSSQVIKDLLFNFRPVQSRAAIAAAPAAPTSSGSAAASAPQEPEVPAAATPIDTPMAMSVEVEEGMAVDGGAVTAAGGAATDMAVEAEASPPPVAVPMDL